MIRMIVLDIKTRLLTRLFLLPILVGLLFGGIMTNIFENIYEDLDLNDKININIYHQNKEEALPIKYFLESINSKLNVTLYNNYIGDIEETFENSKDLSNIIIVKDNEIDIYDNPSISIESMMVSMYVAEYIDMKDIYEYGLYSGTSFNKLNEYINNEYTAIEVNEYIKAEVEIAKTPRYYTPLAFIIMAILLFAGNVYSYRDYFEETGKRKLMTPNAITKLYCIDYISGVIVKFIQGFILITIMCIYYKGMITSLNGFILALFMFFLVANISVSLQLLIASIIKKKNYAKNTYVFITQLSLLVFGYYNSFNALFFKNQPLYYTFSSIVEYNHAGFTRNIMPAIYTTIATVFLFNVLPFIKLYRRAGEVK